MKGSTKALDESKSENDAAFVTVTWKNLKNTWKKNAPAATSKEGP